MTFIFKKRIHFKLVKHTLLLQGVNCYLNNIEWLLIRTIYDIEFRNDYSIKHKRIFFDLMEQELNLLDVLYMHENIIFLDKIMENQSIIKSAVEVERLNIKKRYKKREGRYIQAFSKKRLFCE